MDEYLNRRRTPTATARAWRETVGLSQLDAAKELGVNVRSVKRWEDPRAGYLAPDIYWELLERYMDAQREAVDAALEEAQGAEAEDGRPPALVPLTYYRAQWDYDANGVGDGPYTVANASARAAGEALAFAGYRVEYRYPEEEAVRTPFSRQGNVHEVREE